MCYSSDEVIHICMHNVPHPKMHVLITGWLEDIFLVCFDFFFLITDINLNNEEEICYLYDIAIWIMNYKWLVLFQCRFGVAGAILFADKMLHVIYLSFLSLL